MNEMEANVELDDEVSGLRQGLAAVKLSKATKLRIRTPWSKALIVKVFGWSMGFNYIYSKLMAPWKPTGRMDCVDLGKAFFLTRFSMKEDYDAIIQKGPWFVGVHFLSIRPWEPDFNVEMTCISSAAVWIKLKGLLIEYYETEVLKEIGQAVGHVLRIDTHTVTESRGQYARLCVQLDLEKPLVTTILIGKKEQPVMHEGLHKVCLSYGRVGHQKEACPYTIRCHRQPATNSPESPTDSMMSGQRTHDIVHHDNGNASPLNVQEDSKDGSYEPWMVVTRKRNPQKMPRTQHIPYDM